MDRGRGFVGEEMTGILGENFECKIGRSTSFIQINCSPDTNVEFHSTLHCKTCCYFLQELCERAKACELLVCYVIVTCHFIFLHSE